MAAIAPPIESIFSIISEALLESHTNINKVALDHGVKGDYRIRDLEMLIGDSNFVATQKENGFQFKLEISKVYFSPRLAMERKRIYDIAISNEDVLDAFAGASPFAVSLSSKGCNVTAVDANPNSEKWSHKNFSLNNNCVYMLLRCLLMLINLKFFKNKKH